MIEINVDVLVALLTAVLLLGMVLGIALHIHGSRWVARTMDRYLVPIGLHQLPHRVRDIVKHMRAHPVPVPVPMHTHYNVRYKGAHHGMLQLPADECPCQEMSEESPFPPGPGVYR